MTRCQLFLAADAADVGWPDTPDGDYARRYLTPLMQAGVTGFIANAHTEMAVLRLDDLALPVTINAPRRDNCYVCSPYNHYVDYAREELKTLKQPGTEALLGVVLAGLGLGLAAGQIDRVVHVNNWLLSTNLYPPLSQPQLEVATRLLAARFPQHAIVWRSINTVEGVELHDTFRQAGYQPIASRQLYFQRPADASFYDKETRRANRKDRKLLESSAYEVVTAAQLTLADLPRILALYDLLYLDKYSRHNPQFTLAFLALALAEGTLELEALRHRETGQIDGAVGYFFRNGALTTPLFGYDTTLPQGVGLYRMLTSLTLQAAGSRGLLLNQSSGAGNFKRARGGRGNIESSMVYDRHLSPHRRAVWALLRRLINGIAVPLMRTYKL